MILRVLGKPNASLTEIFRLSEQSITKSFQSLCPATASFFNFFNPPSMSSLLLDTLDAKTIRHLNPMLRNSRRFRTSSPQISDNSQTSSPQISDNSQTSSPQISDNSQTSSPQISDNSQTSSPQLTTNQFIDSY
ncbi:hypothetical protein CDAR_297501 [Caerostris darwini]|uniref:Uncharacterized protein n=1 Tax=Caerostris darwini TaxID=1538125 RepID=A0AAV4PNV1_9ARAC|nr:hypothetical protein CDAR_297501 [Caerostris darwini]